MIEIRERFDVPAGPDAVWAVLSDPHAVVGCVPGAKIDQQHDDGSMDASVVVKFGPTRVTFRVKASLDLDEAARQGHDHRPGQGHHRRHADALDGDSSA